MRARGRSIILELALAELAAAGAAALGGEALAGTTILETKSFWRFRTVWETDEIITKDGKIGHLSLTIPRNWYYKNKDKPTDYACDVEGIRALDRYTIQITLTQPCPRILWILCMSYLSAVPREAVEYYGEEFLNHPVGTGPFRLKRWDHWHKIVLERNPTYRDDLYPGTGEPPDPETGYEGDMENGLLRDAGRRLPLADRIVYTIIKQDQPAWLYFLSGYVDSSGIPKDSWNSAMSSLMEPPPGRAA